jgi:hypothetical protein
MQMEAQYPSLPAIALPQIWTETTKEISRWPKRKPPEAPFWQSAVGLASAQ